MLAGLIVTASLPAAAEVVGTAEVIDGDTIRIRGQEIQLRGIDAPELDQTCETRRGTPHPCGRIAKQVLGDLIAGQALTCKGDARDGDGRLLAVCAVGRIDINAQMVLQGWALAAITESKDYVKAEAAARRLRDGLWKRRFVTPWDWRRGKRLESE